MMICLFIAIILFVITVCLYIVILITEILWAFWKE
nr:MAG TPA: hypothetical protein [Caudoviricetes sp.]